MAMICALLIKRGWGGLLQEEVRCRIWMKSFSHEQFADRETVEDKSCPTAAQVTECTQNDWKSGCSFLVDDGGVGEERSDILLLTEEKHYYFTNSKKKELPPFTEAYSL